MPKPINQDVLQETSVRYFLEVIQTGSMTAAAERMNVAPSAISRHIAKLEAELGTLLFERHARGMAPNAAGELLANYARRARREIGRVAEEIHALQGSHTGVIREGFASGFLPVLLAAFQRDYAGIRFVLQVARTRQIPDRVRKGEVDIGVTVSTVSEKGICVEIRQYSPIIAVLYPEHPLADSRNLALAQLTGHAIALPGPDTTLRQLFDISCSRQGLVFNAMLECDHLDPCIGFVTARGGMTIGGVLALKDRLIRNELVGIPLRDREMTERHFEVQTLAGRVLPRAVKVFLEFLEEKFRSETQFPLP